MKILTLACLVIIAVSLVSSEEYRQTSKYERKRVSPVADHLGGLYSRAQRRSYVRGFRGRHHNTSEENKKDTNRQENKNIQGSRSEDDSISTSQEKKYVPNYRSHRNVSERNAHASQTPYQSASTFGETAGDGAGSDAHVRSYARGGRRGISKKSEEDVREVEGINSYRSGSDNFSQARNSGYGSEPEELSKDQPGDSVLNSDLISLRYKEALRKRERLIPQIITGSSSGRIYRGYPQSIPVEQKIVSSHMESGEPYVLRYGDKLEAYVRGYGSTPRFAETTTQVVQPYIQTTAPTAPSQEVSESSQYQASTTTSVPSPSSFTGSLYVGGYQGYAIDPPQYPQQPYKNSLIGSNNGGYNGALSYVHISQGLAGRQQAQQKLAPYNKEVWVPISQRYPEQTTKSYYTPVPQETLYHTKQYPIATVRPYQVHEQGSEYVVSDKKMPHQEKTQSQIPVPLVSSAPIPTPAPITTPMTVSLPKLPIIQENKNSPIYQQNYRNYAYPLSVGGDYGDRTLGYRGLQVYGKELNPQQESYMRFLGANIYRPYIIPVNKNTQLYYQTHGNDGQAQGVSYRETMYGGSGSDVRNGYDANGFVLKNGGYYINGGKLASGTRGSQVYHNEDLYRGGQDSVSAFSATRETPTPAQHPYLVRYVKSVDLSLPHSAPASAHKHYDIPNFRTYIDTMDKNVNYPVEKRTPYTSTKVAYSQPDPLHISKPFSYANQQINVPVSQQMSFHRNYPSTSATNNYEERGYEGASTGASAVYHKKELSNVVPWRSNYQRQAIVAHHV